MGEKDITHKTLEAYNDVFADIVNVLLFNGRQVIDENDLVDAQINSFYKAEGKIRSLERDTSKFWAKSNIRIALIGLENQDKYDKYMSLRVIGYDGANYRFQISDVDEDGKIKAVYPVVTMVLYFGRHKWKKNTSLKEVLKIPRELIPYFNDYKINLFQISFLSDEQVEMFKSDFKVVAEYFVKSRKDKNYIPDPGELRHVNEILELMRVMTGDDRFQEELENRQNKGDSMGRERALDNLERSFFAKGMQQGMQQGMEQGMANGQRVIIEKALRNGNSAEAVSAFASLPLDEVKAVEAEMLKGEEA